jgi:WD40 repeat protein
MTQRIHSQLDAPDSGGTRACPACHASVAAGVTFCPQCGQHIAAPSTPDAVAPPGNERRCVWGVAYSPDGQMLASGHGDGAIRLWCAADGRLLRTLSGHAGAVHCLAFSSDMAMRLNSFNVAPRQTLASGGDDMTVRLWNVLDGALLHTLQGHTSPPVLSVAFSLDGLTLLSGADDNTVRVWRVAYWHPSFQPEHALADTLIGHGGYVTSVSWSRDARYFASADPGQPPVRVWPCAMTAERHELGSHRAEVRSLAWSPTGATLACGCSDGAIRLWDVDQERLLHLMLGHDGAVAGVAWSPDGRTLVSVGADVTARLWRAADGTLLRLLPAHY